MSLFAISWSYIKEKPLNTFLNTLLLSLGIGIIVVLLLMSHQVQSNLEKNAKGIDLVVGAKGSPLQLILSSIYHIDFPTGNIPLIEAQKIAANRRMVEKAIPLALGDSYREFRIVGTNQLYRDVYSAEIESGAFWQDDLEVTIGANVAKTLGFEIGDEFQGEHGLTSNGHSHDEHNYKIVGILKQSNSVLDNLILTNVESVWVMHEKEGSEDHHGSDKLEPDIFGIKIGDQGEDKELTSLLIKYRSPRAAMQFPRMVNNNSSLQAASPPFETARLFNLIGAGVEIIRGFAYLIIVIAGLSVFIALYNSLKDRKYDLAIMRSMGASRTRIMSLILIEGMIITAIGGIMGFVLGHGVVELLGQLMATANQNIVTGQLFLSNEWLVALMSLVLGIFVSIIPAVEAYKTDISEVLANG
ncbi:MAG: FtsX-like permease family protein [Cyclobacteriaceae bacterium]